MKNLHIAFVSSLFLLAACNNNNTNTYAGSAKQLTKRNLTITKENAYSDLFLDSAKIEQFIAQQKMSDSVANDLRSFYNARNLQFAWFNSEGFTEQALAFNSLYGYTEDSARKALDRKLDEMMADDSLTPSASDKNIIKTELSLSWRFINYIWGKYPDTEKRMAVLENYIPSQKKSSLKLAEEIIENEKANQIANPSYIALNNQLKSLLDTLRNKPDTGAGKSLKDSLTIKVQQLLVNMERMKWMPEKPEGKLIVVNIPEFKLHVRNGSAEDFNMDVVVGKEGHNTVIFSGELNQIVFSPYWNVPPSIVRKEILPAIEKNKNYLAEKNMEITGEENGLPVVRQLPGAKNDLGRVKFLFPNSFNIYFHDTPYKELFKKDKRAYSHGCIRLSDPVKMAQYLLQDQKEWTPGKIDSAMNSEKEKYVKIKDPVPVLISYYTTWVDGNGAIVTAEDIYNHDKKIASKLFTDSRL